MTRSIAPKSGLARILAAVAVTAAMPAAGQIDPFDGEWHFSLTPYLWLPNVNADLNQVPSVFPADQFKTEIGPNNYLENLQFGLLVTGEVRKGRWSALTDLIYLDFGRQDTRVRDITGPRGMELFERGIQAETSLASTLWTLAGGYTAIRRSDLHLDLLLGFRYLGLDTDLRWTFLREADLPELDAARSGRTGRDEENWDAIVGLKGQIFLGDTPWFLPYYLDVGTGDSDWTWQALLGVAYRFEWGDVNLSIRSLSYDFDESGDDLRFTGPALGVSFVW